MEKTEPTEPMTSVEPTEPPTPTEPTVSIEPTVSPEAPLTLRWRIHKGELSLRRRHFRALDTLDLPGPLRGWIYERLEWAIVNMLNKDTEAVLVLNMDPAKEATISLDELREAPALTEADLVEDDGFISGVRRDGKPIAGSVWVERDGVLYASRSELYTATDTLALDLLKTLKISAIIEPQRLKGVEFDSIFLISDEFGFVPIGENHEREALSSAKLKECFLRLW